MNRQDILDDWLKADELASRMAMLGMPKHKVDAYRETTTAYYCYLLDTLEQAS